MITLEELEALPPCPADIAAVIRLGGWVAFNRYMREQHPDVLYLRCVHPHHTQDSCAWCSRTGFMYRDGGTFDGGCGVLAINRILENRSTAL